MRDNPALADDPSRQIGHARWVNRTKHQVRVVEVLVAVELQSDAEKEDAAAAFDLLRLTQRRSSVSSRRGKTIILSSDYR